MYSVNVLVSTLLDARHAKLSGPHSANQLPDRVPVTVIEHQQAVLPDTVILLRVRKKRE